MENGVERYSIIIISPLTFQCQYILTDLSNY